MPLPPSTPPVFSTYGLYNTIIQYYSLPFIWDILFSYMCFLVLPCLLLFYTHFNMLRFSFLFLTSSYILLSTFYFFIFYVALPVLAAALDILHTPPLLFLLLDSSIFYNKFSNNFSLHTLSMVSFLGYSFSYFSYGLYMYA